jgi:hypothetical protein
MERTRYPTLPKGGVKNRFQASRNCLSVISLIFSEYKTDRISEDGACIDALRCLINEGSGGKLAA